MVIPHFAESSLNDCVKLGSKALTTTFGIGVNPQTQKR